MKTVSLLLFTLLMNLASAEVVEYNFTSGDHTFHTEGMSNFKYPFITIEDDIFLMVTHSSTYWDTDKITWKGIEKLVQFFKTNNHAYKYLASIDERGQRPLFPTGISSQDIYPYQGDSHRIIIKGKNLVSAGGNFTICACNATRSALALSQVATPIQVYFPMDAIYEGENGSTRTLKNISDQIQDKDFIRYLEEVYFNSDTLPCKEPSLYALDRTFSYKIYRGNKFIGLFGRGNTLVEMHFNSTDEVLNLLQDK